MPTAQSYLDLVQAQCRIECFPWPIPEYRFHPTRKWAFDFAWPSPMIALEIQGGIWTKGKHARGKGIEKDMEKLNTAQSMGWTVLQVTPAQIKDKSWVGIFADAFDLWVARYITWKPNDRVTLPGHAKQKE